MIFKIVSYLPMGVLYVISDVLYLIMYYLFRYRLQVVQENVALAFPEVDQKTRDKIIKAFYHNLSDFMMETLKGMTISAKEINRRVIIEEKEAIEKYFREGQSVIIMTSHQFNWEWLLFACCLQLSAPMNPVYKLLNNGYFDRLMFKTRSRFGSRPIEMQETLVEVVRRKGVLSGFGLIADQIPLPDAEKYWAKFLGRETAFFVGSEKIAHMTKYPVVFAGIKKVKRGHYRVYFENIAAPPYDKKGHEILDNYIEKSEKILREQPASWLWSHRRWKYQKPLYDD